MGVKTKNFQIVKEQRYALGVRKNSVVKIRAG
jgi:hypothetical protein